MTPQLGVLSDVHPRAAAEVFARDCLIYLGTAIVPIGNAPKEGDHCVTITAKLENGETIERSITYGSIDIIPLGEHEFAEITAKPSGHFDLGAGKGREVLRPKVRGGVAGGIIIDARGRRPFLLPTDKENRIRKLKEWFVSMNIYPMEILERYMNPKG
jgi:hypothetical protein